MAKLHPILFSALFIFAIQACFQACVMDSEPANGPAVSASSASSAPSSSQPSSAASASSTPSNPNIPKGCFMEWNSSEGDSTMVCGDPAPPKMK